MSFDLFNSEVLTTVPNEELNNYKYINNEYRRNDYKELHEKNSSRTNENRFSNDEVYNSQHSINNFNYYKDKKFSTPVSTGKANFKDFYQNITNDEIQKKYQNTNINKETLERNYNIRKNLYFKIIFQYPSYFSIRLNLNLQRFLPRETDKFFIPDIKTIIFSKLEDHEILKGQYINFTVDSITLSNRIYSYEGNEYIFLDDIISNPDLELNEDGTKDFVLEAKFNSSFLKELKQKKENHMI